MTKAIIETPRKRKYLTLTHAACPRNKGGWGNSTLDVIKTDYEIPEGSRSNSPETTVIYTLQCPTCKMVTTLRMDNAEIVR